MEKHDETSADETSKKPTDERKVGMPKQNDARTARKYTESVADECGSAAPAGRVLRTRVGNAQHIIERHDPHSEPRVDKCVRYCACMQRDSARRAVKVWDKVQDRWPGPWGCRFVPRRPDW